MLTLGEHLAKVADRLVETTIICSHCDKYRYYKDTGAECSCGFCVTDDSCPLSTEINAIVDKADKIETELEELVKSKASACER